MGQKDHPGDELEPAENKRTRQRNSFPWSFCSRSKPCNTGQGDCDGDHECQAGLKCGHDNCKDFNAGAHSLADCCVGGFSNVRASSQLSPQYGPEKAIDGIISEGFGNIFHSGNEEYPWLELSMPEGYISAIEIVRRYDCCADRIRDLEIRAGMDPVPNNFKGMITVNKKVASFDGPADTNLRSYRICFERSVRAKYVTIQKNNARNSIDPALEINEVIGWNIISAGLPSKICV